MFGVSKGLCICRGSCCCTHHLQERRDGRISMGFHIGRQMVGSCTNSGRQWEYRHHNFAKVYICTGASTHAHTTWPVRKMLMGKAKMADVVVAIAVPPSHQEWQKCQWPLRGVRWCHCCHPCCGVCSASSAGRLTHQVLPPAAHAEGSTTHTGQEKQSH